MAGVGRRHSYPQWVTRDGSATREKLLDAAAKAFAEHGVVNASMLDITRNAGQRNRGALHYHFGSRDGVLAAVLDRHVDFLEKRERELLDKALSSTPVQLALVVEAIVRPVVELAASGWRGRCYLLIVAELAGEMPNNLAPEVAATLAKTAGRSVYDALAERLPALPVNVRDERLALITVFMLRAVADRARLMGLRRKSRPQLDDEAFIKNLVAMVVAAVFAPVA
ncbi:MAG: hypothetical protein QOI70_1929 [Microbacteriaceae bacterium]|jgi:AcrR family transcriptional regulator|nr:hypothetical protein [Microbacteriaceae bacterium]